MNSTEHLTFERRGATAIVTMNRPEAKNTLSLPMLVGMADAWTEIDGNDDIRCAILTGAGGTFCSGMDLKSMSGPDAETYKDRTDADPDLHWKALLRHYQLRKPLIAAVEGWAVAGGTEILQATDIRVAGEGAKFGVFEARRGLFPLGGSTVRLRRQIPFTVAMDLLLTAREVSAEEALRIGLIGRVVPDGTALDEALGIAEVICANGPLAVEAIKRSVQETEGISEVEALKIELEIGMPIFATEDAAKDRRRSQRSGHRSTSAGDGGRGRMSPEDHGSVSDFGMAPDTLSGTPLSGAETTAGSDAYQDPRYELAAVLRRITTAVVGNDLTDAEITSVLGAAVDIATTLEDGAGPKRRLRAIPIRRDGPKTSFRSAR